MWEGTGRDLGYWTEDNENWYQRRVREIQEQNGQPRTSSEWRTLLARELRIGQIKDFKSHVASFNDEFLRGESLFE